MAWYTAPSGATCVAAYDAIGAASLADSYVNEVTPGTYNAAPGVAPAWAYGTGWTFNGTTQYLTTGYVPGAGSSLIARVSGLPNTNNHVAGLYLVWAVGAWTAKFFYAHGSWKIGAAIGLPFTGVLAVANTKGYVNGAADPGTVTGAGGVATAYIGAGNSGGVATAFAACSVQAVAFYSGTLSAADVLALTTAMNALPTAAGMLLLAGIRDRKRGGKTGGKQ